MTTDRYVAFFDELGLSDVPKVGGKNASIGELVQGMRGEGASIRVPDGFAVTADAFRLHIRSAGLERSIYPALDSLDTRNVTELSRVAREVRDSIRAAPLPEEVARSILSAYAELSRRFGEEATDVAVRSSATSEDLPEASFAGQQESYLNVRGKDRVLTAVRDCMASLFTDRAIVYRVERGFDHRSVALSAGVQKMVRSDLGAAGVIFTLDTETGFRDAVVITAAYGLGEVVVQGRANPDEYWVHKPTLERGFRPIVRRDLGAKAIKLVYAEGGNRTTREVRVPGDEQARFVLSEDEILELARVAVRIEKHYSKRADKPLAMDIEWAKDGQSGALFVVQARPETVHSRSGPPKFELFRLRSKGHVIAMGKSVGANIGVGKARVIHSTAELSSFEPGEVLVTEMTDPDWEPVLKRAAAVVTDHGGRTCHAAIISRELGIPCVAGTGNGTRVIKTGDPITVSCAEGNEGHVYAGLLAFDREEVDPKALPTPRVPIMLNVGNPENAFLLGQLPSAGVGLARLEFIVSSWIGIHPMALLHPDRLDSATVGEIAKRTRGFDGPVDFFVDRLASGVAQIAAAFYPRPVIVRFSDFKTNEYASLLGGQVFEPTEANPMIGFRGASRYYDERYRNAFALECRAIRKVREEMGLANVKVMIPFCRTLDEGKRVLVEMGYSGLRRGEHALEVYVMCEIPNNVILAEEFSELFDGFSIGSNDLTQLTLGVDRDSELLSHIFDEQDPGVKKMIEMVVGAAHRKGRKVGLCGQAPSDHPEFAAFLADLDIDSISVTADALPRVTEVLAG